MSEGGILGSWLTQQRLRWLLLKYHQGILINYYHSKYAAILNQSDVLQPVAENNISNYNIEINEFWGLHVIISVKLQVA